ncbi:unnamed protein product, partial [marine sediment metagenome]
SSHHHPEEEATESHDRSIEHEVKGIAIKGGSQNLL